MVPGAWISMWQLVLQASDDVPENDEWKQNRLEVGNKINSEDKDATVVRFVNAWRVCLILAKWSLTFWLCKSSLACSLYGLNFGSKDTICFWAINVLPTCPLLTWWNTSGSPPDVVSICLVLYKPQGVSIDTLNPCLFVPWAYEPLKACSFYCLLGAITYQIHRW